MEDMDVSDLSSETIKSERKTRQIMGCNYINTDGFFSCLGHPEHSFIGLTIRKVFNSVDRFLVCENLIEGCFVKMSFYSFLSLIHFHLCLSLIASPLV